MKEPHWQIRKLRTCYRKFADRERVSMHIISRKIVREAEKKHSDLVGSLGTWFKVAKKAHSKNVEDVSKNIG
jgi:hypothetical protein